ncbi:hypothetical protein F4604DRAFT_1749032 [Suillus subluteus]|nr:hypothetical protein F4604DRAFT_1749032 [Suillus subluteus]
MSTMTDSQRHGLHHPFLSHLVALLSAYELCPMSTPPPRYDGPADWQTDTIIRSLGAVARRMYTAEEILASIKASECWQTNGPETKKGRSVGRHSHSSTNTNSNLAPSVESIDVADSTNGVASNDRTPVNKPHSARAGSMSLSLDELPAHIDAATLLRSFSNGSSASAPPTSHLEYMVCPTRINSSFDSSPNGSPLVIPPGPLAVATFESGMTAVEELRLLKAQVSDVARVCNAVARGDLSQKITVPVQGVVMVQLKDVINTMVDKLGQFAKEVTRVSQEVGTEGYLAGLAGVVNKLAANLTSQVRSIAKVTKAVAQGDLSKQIDIGNTVNGMVIQLRALAAENLEVGSQGKLGGQAHVPDVQGVWFELVHNVNRMCSSLTDQVRSIANVTAAVARGDLTQKIEIQVEGEMSTLKGTVNSMVEQLSAFASEVTRVALEVGTQGILGGQARVEGVQGTWADLTRNVNVTKAVALGDLSKVVNVDVQGEMLDLKMTVNSMVAQLSALANEVTRVSLEVGTEGILGGQAYVPDVQSMSAK